MTHPLSQRAGLSATALKLIAVAAMTGDHLGWAFLPNASAAACWYTCWGASPCR